MNDRLSLALEAVLVPICRTLIRAGTRSKETIALLRRCFVIAAVRELESTGKPRTTSEISRVTGLSRKTVRDLRFERPTVSASRKLLGNDVGDLLTAWTNDADFLDEQGAPRALEVGPGEGTFDDLVSRRLGEDDSSTILELLIEAGSVELTKDGKARQVKRALLVQHDLPRLLLDLVATASNSLDKLTRADYRHGSLCHRTVYSRNLAPGKVDVARRWMREKITQFSRETDDYLAAHEAHTEGSLSGTSGNKLSRVGVNVVYFEEDG